MPSPQGPACLSLGEILQGQQGSPPAAHVGHQTLLGWPHPPAHTVQGHTAGCPPPQLKTPPTLGSLGHVWPWGDPLASCPLLASVHQPSEGWKHLQEPACLAPHSGSLPSSLPPPDLPYPAPFIPQDAPLSPPCH